VEKLTGLRKIKTAVFISGAGSNLKNLIDFSINKKSPISIDLIISNTNKAKGLRFAKQYNIKKKIFNFGKAKIYWIFEILGFLIFQTLFSKFIESILTLLSSYFFFISAFGLNKLNKRRLTPSFSNEKAHLWVCIELASESSNNFILENTND